MPRRNKETTAFYYAVSSALNAYQKALVDEPENSEKIKRNAFDKIIRLHEEELEEAARTGQVPTNSNAPQEVA